MSIANSSVALLLRSPLHPLLSAKLQLVRYVGRRSGVEYETPTQYVELTDDRVAILVGDPAHKSWWKNFNDDWPLDLLVRGTWHHTRARTCWFRDDPAAVADVVHCFAEKYGERHIPIPGTDTLIVVCEPDGSP